MYKIVKGQNNKSVSFMKNEAKMLLDICPYNS